MHSSKLSVVLGVLLFAGAAWAAAPAAPVPVNGPGLYHEFNDLNVTYGWDYLTTSTAAFTWDTPGVLTHPSALSEHALHYRTGDEHNDVAFPMRSDRDWVAKFRMQKNHDISVAKVIEMRGLSETDAILQVDFDSDGRLGLVYGPYGLNDPCEYPKWVGSNVFDPNIMHDMVVAYDGDTELLDIYVDDALILAGVECKGSASGNCGDLYGVAIRGNCDYDEMIFYQNAKPPPRAKNPSLLGDTGLWMEFSGETPVPTYGQLTGWSAGWTWHPPGIGYNPTLGNGATWEWKTVKDGEGQTSMPTDEDWVVQLTMARDTDQGAGKLIEFGAPAGAGGVQVELLADDTVQIVYGENTGVDQYPYYQTWNCPPGSFPYDSGDPCDYRTLAFHYKVNTQTIDFWADSLLLFENFPGKYIPQSGETEPGYAISLIRVGGIAFYDEIMIGPYDVQPPFECGDTGTVYTTGDVNEDCYTDLTDFGLLAAGWLQCTDPANSACDDFWTQVEFGAPVPVIDSGPGLWVDFNEPNDAYGINYGKLGINHKREWYISTLWNYSNGGPGTGPGEDGVAVSVPHAGWPDDNLYYIAQAGDDPNDPNDHTQFDGSTPWAIQFIMKLQPDVNPNAGFLEVGSGTADPADDLDPCMFLMFSTNNAANMIDQIRVHQGDAEGLGEWATESQGVPCTWNEYHTVTVVYDPTNPPADPNDGYLEIWVDDVKRASARSRTGQHNLGVVLLYNEVAYDDVKVSGNLVQGPFECGDFGTVYKDGDLDTDCDVDLDDLRLLIGPWLECTDPVDPNCYSY